MSTHRYDWKRSRPRATDPVFRPALMRAGVPVGTSVITDGLPPVYNQGQCGSCTANAAAVLWRHALYREHLPDLAPSRMFDYYNERVLQGTVALDSGATVRDALQALMQFGTVPETDWPYTEPFAAKPLADLYAQATHHVQSYARVAQQPAAVFAALASGHVVQFGFEVFASFESDAVASSGVVPMPDTAGEALLGGHSCAIIGIGGAASQVRVRNSWGGDWGMAGDFLMPFDYLFDPQLAGDFWIINYET
ncbi:MAG: C1 family peptidase [Steroidobacteraceae bacterium]